MPPKRKRSSISANPPNKAQKRASKKHDEDFWDLEDDEVFQVIAILDENDHSYLIHWAPDKRTGKIYPHEWTAKNLVTPACIKEWELKKKKEGIVVPSSKRGRARPRKSGESIVNDDKSASSPGDQQSETQGDATDKESEAEALIEEVDNTIEDTETQATPLTKAQRRRERRTIKAKARKAKQEQNQREKKGLKREEANKRDEREQRKDRKNRKVAKGSPEPSEDDASAKETAAPTKNSTPVLLSVANRSSQKPTRPSLTNLETSVPSNPFAEDTPSPASVGGLDLERRASRLLRVHISPLPESQKEQFQTLDVSPFRSSQVLSGSQPAPEDLSPSEGLDESNFIDDTDAPVNTQHDSDYQQETSGEVNDTTTSTAVSTSSAAHTFAVLPQTARALGLVIPDSQSLEYPTSYEPSTQSLPLVVPESSAVQPVSAVFQEDSTTESAIEPADSTRIVEDNSSADENESDEIVHFQSGQVEDPSPEANTASSTSSPPLTESPEKSTQSQPRSQEQQPTEQVLPPVLPPAARQAPILANTDRTALNVSNKSSLPFQTQIAPEHWTPQFFPKVASERPQPIPKLEPENLARPSIESTLRTKHHLTSATGVERQNSPRLLNQLLQARRTNTTPVTEFRARSLTQILDDDRTARSESSRTRVNTYSPLQPAPSQWPDTFASAPPRPATSSDLSSRPVTQMTRGSPARSATPSLRERLALARGAKEVKMPNKDNESNDLLKASMGIVTRSGRLASPNMEPEPRSPSAVPHTEEIPMPTEKEGRTSGRYPTLVPDSTEDGPGRSNLAVSQVTTETQSAATESKVTEVKPTEFVVPIYFSGQQRDHYRQTIIYFKNFLEEFRTQLWPANSSHFLKAVDLVKRLHQVCLHPDLNNEEIFTQAQIDAKGKAQWDIDTSSKFRFLETLLSALSEEDMHVILFVQDPRLLEILDIFLTGINIQHQLVSESQETPASGFHVTILPASQTVGDLRKADLVVLLEGAFQIHQNSLKPLRSDENGRRCPLLTLVIPESVEHIERAMQSHHTQLAMEEKLSILVDTLTIYRNDAGLKPNHALDPRQTATAVAAYLAPEEQDSDEDWPLDDLADVNIQFSLNSQTTSTDEPLEAFGQVVGGMKRTFDNDAEEQQSKRTRVDDMPMTINPADISITHISDSIPTQPVPLSQHEAEIDALKLSHQRKEIEMQDKLQAMQDRLTEHVAALEDLQYRFEDQRAELVKATKETDDAQQKAVVFATQLNNKDVLIAKTRVDRDDFRDQLLEARKAMLDHSVPERVELETLKVAAAEAEKEKTKAESRIKSMSNDLDYIRNMYQDVSNKSTGLADERNELEAKVKILEQKASGEMTRAKQMSKDTVAAALRSEKRRLELMLKDRETLLVKKDEEITRLKEAQRGRMGTRGSSVPPGARSPVRLQSPMRLEPPRAGVSSRAVSPARAGRASPAPGSHGKSKLGR